jgi:fatty acid desaturase
MYNSYPCTQNPDGLYSIHPCLCMACFFQIIAIVISFVLDILIIRANPGSDCSYFHAYAIIELIQNVFLFVHYLIFSKCYAHMDSDMRYVEKCSRCNSYLLCSSLQFSFIVLLVFCSLASIYHHCSNIISIFVISVIFMFIKLLLMFVMTFTYLTHVNNEEYEYWKDNCPRFISCCLGK